METVTAYLKFMKSFLFLVGFFFPPSQSENTDEKSGNKSVGVVDKTEICSGQLLVNLISRKIISIGYICTMA